MNLQQLYYFQMICRTKNYTRAAERLLVAQSSLSHSISDLESELGVQLFYRTGRNIDMTECGKRYLEYVDRILSELEKANQEMEAMRTVNKGRIRIAISHTTSNRFIPDMIKGFKNLPKNHDVRFELAEKQMANIISAFSSGLIDLGFGARMDSPQLEYYHIFDETFIAVVPSRHPLAKCRSVSLKELADEPLITYSTTCGTRYWIDELFQRFEITPHIVQLADTEKVMASAVACGIGIAIMPHIPELSVYDVTALTLEDNKLLRPMYMCWQKDKSLRPVVKSFRDYVIAQTQTIL